MKYVFDVFFLNVGTSVERRIIKNYFRDSFIDLYLRNKVTSLHHLYTYLFVIENLDRYLGTNGSLLIIIDVITALMLLWNAAHIY